MPFRSRSKGDRRSGSKVTTVRIPSSLCAWSVTATVVLAAVAVSSGALNAFEPVKLLVVVTGAAVALVALWLSGAGSPGGGGTANLKDRRVPLIAAGAVVGVIVVAAVVSSADPAASLMGSRTRWGGLLLYAACAGLLLVATSLGHAGVRNVLAGVAVAGGLVAAVGLLQWLGAPILDGVGSQFGSPSTLGNINFAAAYVGASAGAMAWMAVEPGFDRIIRSVGVGLLVLAFGYTVVSTSFQGVPTLGAAVGVVALHHAWTRGGNWRRVGVPVAAVVAVVAGGLVVAGILQTGPLSALGAESGVELRRGYWDAAVGMISDNPILGVGPERYVYAFRTNRSFQAAANTDVMIENDAAHNILLHHGTAGGLVLMLAFVVLVVAVAVYAVRGFRHPQVDTRLLAGAVAVLAGYLVQGLVSIDVAALASLGWVAMGLVLAASRPPPVTVKARGRKPKRVKPPRPATVGWPRLTAAGVIVAVAVAVAAQPLRAETQALSGQRQTSGDGTRLAADIGVWDPRYDEALGLSRVAGDGDGVALLESLYDRKSLTGSGAIQAARRLAPDDPAAAAVWYQRALQLDPLHPELRLEAAQFFGQHGQVDQARQIVSGLLQDDPDNAAAVTLSRELERSGEGAS